MLQNQLYILATIFASRADEKRLGILKENINEFDDLLDAVCVLWPELEEPTSLRFLLSEFEKPKVKADDDNLLVLLLEDGSDLVPFVEMDIDTVSERCSVVKEFVNRKLAEITLDDQLSFENWRSEWLRKRILLCDEVNPYKSLYNIELCEYIRQEDANFAKWVDGILKPLDFINDSSYFSLKFKIKDFQNLQPIDVINIFTDRLFHQSQSLKYDIPNLIDQLIPYLEYTNSYSLFLEKFFNVERFNFDETFNYKVFNAIFMIFKQRIDSPFKDDFEKTALLIIFQNSKKLMNIISINSLKSLLEEISPMIELDNHLNSKVLLSYSIYINTILQDYSLKDIYTISNETEEVQLVHFTSVIKAQLMSNNFKSSPTYGLKSILDIIPQNESETGLVFTQINSKRQISVLMDLLLEFGEFDLLQNLVRNKNSELEETALEKYFWHFFNNATNGLSSRPEMKKAERTVQLLLEQNENKFRHLKTLLHVSDLLGNYSLNLGKGIPFKPSNIFDFKQHPSQIISKLLELNKNLYKDCDITGMILKEIFEGMNLDSNSEFFHEEYTKLLEFHIDNALANMDFYFAFHKSKEVLKNCTHTISWATLFQVCKFVDPNWLDNEIPTELLLLQMELTSDLLQICPTDEMEIIISQWSALELELLTRDIINDKYSISHSNEYKNEFSKSANLLDGVSSSVTNFISSTLS